MKSQYERGATYFWWNEWARERYVDRYCLVVGHYHRHVRTMNELRQLRGADHDGEPVRRRRLTLPTSYDDPMISRNFGKSWKDYTKRRKQWDR